MAIILVYMLPVITALLSWLPLGRKDLRLIQVSGMLLLFGTSGLLAYHLTQQGPLSALNHWVYLDALSGIMLLIISLIAFFSSLYAHDYFDQKMGLGQQPIRKLKLYYSLTNLFLLTMLVMVTTNNLGLFWIAIESSTLFTAFLVGFYNEKEPIEAAWKYVMLCATGIALAVIGLTICYFAVIRAGGLHSEGMNWNYLMTIAHHLDPKLMKVAFIFVLVGYGAKAGLAPLHNWLPDAYSEAPAPITALLSGTLSKCALYGIIRYAMITNLCLGSHFTGELLMFFGFLSLAIAVPFILIQTNIKRLLAYSSIEHIGIIAIGLGIGTPLAVFGALFHMVNHALVKSLMFYTAGNISTKFKSKKINLIQSTISFSPLNGVFLLIGGIALAGSPPFSLFLSEFYILKGSLQGGFVIQTLLMIVLLLAAFSGLTYHFIQMSIGPEPELVAENYTLTRRESFRLGSIPLLIPFLLLLLLGLWQPQIFLTLLHQSAQLITQGQAQ
jgi:hydrogenase-4 component F